MINTAIPSRIYQAKAVLIRKSEQGLELIFQISVVKVKV
jgi:hypothetical protein